MMKTGKRPIEILLLAWSTIGLIGLTAGALWLLPYFIAHEQQKVIEQLHQMLQEMGSETTREELARAFQPDLAPALKEMPLFYYAEYIASVWLVLGLTTAIGLLYAKHWARVLFIVLTVLGLLETFTWTGVIGLAGSMILLLLQLPLTLVFLVILLSPRANTYFSSPPRP